jgi:hypothetical protein
VQAVALAPADDPTPPQRVPLGLAESGAIVELIGDLAGDLHAYRLLRFGCGGCWPVGLVGQ